MSVHVFLNDWTCMCIYVHVYLIMYIYTHVCMCMYVCTYVYLYIGVCMCVHVCECVFICFHVDVSACMGSERVCLKLRQAWNATDVGSIPTLVVAIFFTTMTECHVLAYLGLQMSSLLRKD